MGTFEADVDRLFQLPLADFTAERNALAKRAGRDGAAIKALQKPPLGAWAVNQLYWQDREQYDALVDAATEMRTAHRDVIEGRTADLRAAGREHEIALDQALKATLALLREHGLPVTDATRQAILNTLRALPAEEAPGRLTRTLAPGGFEMLAGIDARAGRRKSPPARTPAPARQKSAAPAAAVQGAASARQAAAAREAARAREVRAALERAVRDADQRARHAEFEAARASRESARADKRLEEALAALEEARETHADAERDAATATAARDRAEKAVKDARASLDAARAKLESA